MIKPKKLHMWYHTSVGTRDKNEDNLLWPGKRIRLLKKEEYGGEKQFEIKERQSLSFAVSDGMGGAAAGEYASLNVIIGLSKSLNTRFGNRAQRINDRILRLQSRHGECGATLVCCEFRTDGASVVAYVESIGDTSAFVMRDGRVHKLTRDDTLYQDLLEAGNLPESEEDICRAKSGLTRYFGQPNAVVSTQKYKLLCEPGDVFVLCSDGVSLEDGNEAYFLCNDKDPAKKLVLNSICENKFTTGESDNATAIVIKVEE